LSEPPANGAYNVRFKEEIDPLISLWYYLFMSIILRTDPELDAALERLATSAGQSRQEVLKRLILERDAQMNHVNRVDAITKRVIAEDADVLERLGSV
jgi:hypothetical protein